MGVPRLLVAVGGLEVRRHAERSRRGLQDALRRLEPDHRVRWLRRGHELDDGDSQERRGLRELRRLRHPLRQGHRGRREEGEELVGRDQQRPPGHGCNYWHVLSGRIDGLRAQAAPDLSKELGACPPLGFWDPLGLSKYTDPKVAELQFRRRRVIEIQHGRVSMLACIGYIVPEFVRFPGYLSPSADLKFEDMPNGLAAAFKMPFVGWSQIIAFAGFVEVTNLTTETRKNAGDYENFGAFGIPFGKGIEDAAKKEKSLLAEINNGRLAT